MLIIIIIIIFSVLVSNETVYKNTKLDAKKHVAHSLSLSINNDNNNNKSIKGNPVFISYGSCENPVVMGLVPAKCHFNAIGTHSPCQISAFMG